jgi:hypothetical protein
MHIFRSNKLEDLRILLFVSWLIFGIGLCLFVLVKVSMAGPESAAGLAPMMKYSFSLWLPALACFASFWFKENKADGGRAEASAGQRIGAIGLTYGYFLIAAVWLAAILLAPPRGDTILPTLYGDTVAMLLILSPVMLAPVAWLTGSQPEQPALP